MIESLFLGRVSLKIDGFETPLLVEKLYHTCKVISLYTKSDTVYLTTFGSYEKRVRRLCEESGCICETLERRGAVYTVLKYLRRYGLYAGLVLSILLIYFLSNTVLKIEIKGTSDESLKSEIRAILREEGLYAGAKMSAQNFTKLSNDLFTQSDGIAWASLGSSGSVVYVNVTESTERIKAEKTRIPCNIVADRDCVITDAEVLVGQLEVLIGDAVYKGEILVSGAIEHGSVSTRYYHSLANITGRYEDTVTFKVPYVSVENVRKSTLYRRFISLFELEIPLPSDILDPEAEYEIEHTDKPVKLFGLTLPVSLVTYKCTEIERRETSRSTAEALYEVYRRLDSYEKNILKGKTIVDRQTFETADDAGITLTVHYTLEGDVGKASEIYIK